ncbi:C4-dicarboxylate ABC transporter permease [Pseudoroseomonas rhizosphaerae]|uniref:TRAP transporter small permease protein n=1 Tax=Teichococcus rhizosphaerae TaxID=1335062 RepID=A0A2C7A9Q5_9PROT|nr:TRAP transporter small permease [Pseudoroseomonas rhizosphaerae]PHK94373.1 C4-dicarboxylate ABC transporter permease [Pseudoroseomonas rhizosphaerae]
MRTAEGALDAATAAMLWIAGAALLLMMVNVTLDVTLKYLFRWPVPGTLEMVSYYFMAATVFFPFAHVQRKRHHIAVTLFTERLPAPARRAVEAAALLLSAVYLAAFGWAGAEEAWEMTQVGEATGAVAFDVLIWPTRWAVPLGTWSMAAWMLLQAVREVAPPRAPAP